MTANRAQFGPHAFKIKSLRTTSPLVLLLILPLVLAALAFIALLMVGGAILGPFLPRRNAGRQARAGSGQMTIDGEPQSSAQAKTASGKTLGRGEIIDVEYQDVISSQK